MIDAILFDFDNTLADTVADNLTVTFEVLRRMDWPKSGELPWPLLSVENYRRANYRYKNWRELYIEGYGMTAEETECAGGLWEESQRATGLRPALFRGVDGMLETLRGASMGVCSQNSVGVIKSALDYHGVTDCISAFIGHEDVPFDRQKPHPEGFLRCLDALGMKGGRYVYVGDHPEDMVFAKAAETALREMGAEATVYPVAALWCGAVGLLWSEPPAAFAKTPEDLPGIIDSFG